MREGEFDCQRCGACCVQTGPQDGNAYVYLDRSEAATLRGLGLPVVRGPLDGFCLGARPHAGAGGRPACAAFVGTLGAGCDCSVYEDRPSVCREFEVGGELCRQAREMVGVPG